MKKMRFFLCVVLSAAALWSCGGDGDGEPGPEPPVPPVVDPNAVEVVNSGFEKGLEGWTRVDFHNGGKVTVEGVCTHICRHGGRKIFLMGTDDTQVIRIEAGEKIGSFKPECVNNVVRVTGTLVEDRIDEAYLAEWELRLKDQIARQHGEGEAGCSAEQQARGESVASSTEKRIADFRARIADRKAKEGKEYLSFYHVDGGSYEVLK